MDCFDASVMFQVYILRLKCSVLPDTGHEVTKRYSDFAALDTTLRSYGVNLPLPPKKVFGKMDSDFIERRQEGLQVSNVCLVFSFHIINYYYEYLYSYTRYNNR